MTGASRGIGLSIAEALAADHDLWLVGRDSQRLEQAAARCRELGATAKTHVTDLCDHADRQALVQAVLGAEAPVLVLVNNAGIAPSAPLSRTDDETWAQVLAVNLTAPFELIRATVPLMKSTGWGRVINIASTSAIKGYRYTSAYSASKGGLVALTRAVATEVAGTGVTINAICPGFTETDISAAAVRNIADKTGRTQGEARKTLESFSPLGRLIDPSEVAAMVTYLVSSSAEAVHGQTICVDGGETA